MSEVKSLYRVRFSDKDQVARTKIWKILCSDFLQKYISENATVLDLGAGYCDFINNINANKKFAVDINPETKKYAAEDVKVVITNCLELPKKLKSTVDVVFTGCLLEHLPSKEEILKMFKEVLRVLKPEGKFLILNPNIRFAATEFWDYFDHLTPISDRSAVEGLLLAGFEIEEVIPKFVPNTVKDRLPKSSLLVKLYLKMPFLYSIFGSQMFIVARKSK